MAKTSTQDLSVLNQIFEIFLKKLKTTKHIARDYSDNDLRGVFFDRVFCVTRYGRSLDWLRVKSKDRLLFGLEA